jgi:hypothetical protein
MIIAIFHLDGTIRWKLTKESPTIVELQSEPYFAFVNPLTLYDTLVHRSYTPNNYTFRLWKREEEAVLISNVVSFLINPVRETDDNFLWDWQIVSQFLNTLRCTSGQSHIPLSQSILPSKIASSVTVTVDELSSHVFPHELSIDATRGTTDSYVWTSAVTTEDINKAIKLLQGEMCAPHNDIFVDAIDACLNGDYRKCIIYSAMSMEIMANYVLTKKYNERINSEGTSAKDLRVLPIIVNADKTTIIDPIYKALTDKDDFKYRLHELPLYLLGRSLRMENDPLYQRAVDLYKVRNKLVHEGNSEALSFKYAKDVLDCTYEVFKWFDEGKRYTLPFQSNIIFDVINLNSEE